MPQSTNLFPGKMRVILRATLLIGILAVVAWENMRPGEPMYGRKPLGYWLRHPILTAGTNNYPVAGLDTIMTFPNIGSDAVPFLTKALGHQDTFLDRKYLDLWSRFPDRIRSHLPRPVWPGAVRANAARVLCKMGTQGRPAIPALIRVLKSDENEDVRYSAAISLLAIGAGDQTVQDAFIVALNDTSEGIRFIAEAWLGGVRQPHDDVFDNVFSVNLGFEGH